MTYGINDKGEQEETWQDRHRAYDLEKNTLDAQKIVQLIEKTEALGVPYPRFFFKVKGDKMLCMILDASVQMVSFEKETSRDQDAVHSSELVFKTNMIYNFKDKDIQGPRTIVLGPARRDIGYEIAEKWTHYLSQFVDDETINGGYRYPTKKGRLNLAEREWRFNFCVRMWYGLIPQRGSTVDNNSYSEAWKIMGGCENPTEEQHKEWEKWNKKRHKKLSAGNMNSNDWDHRAYMIDGKYYAMFLKKSGLYELVEVPKLEYKRQDLDQDDIRGLLEQTILPPPPTERALPAAVKMDDEKRMRWLNRCPWYMQGWKNLLVKSENMIIEV